MTKVEPTTESEEGSSQPNEDLLESTKKPRSGLLRLAPWKLALIGTAAAVVVIGGGVGAGVGLSGGRELSGPDGGNTLAVSNETVTDSSGNITALNDTTTMSSSGGMPSNSSVTDGVTTKGLSNNNTGGNKTAAVDTTNSSTVNNSTLEVNNSSLILTSKLTSTVAPFTTTTTDSTTTTLVVTAAVTGGSRLERTTIFMRYESSPGETLFLRGGLPDSSLRSCIGTGPPALDPCAVPIRYNEIPAATHFKGYREWSSGDSYIDWNGPEPGQGTSNSKAAAGTPTVWTTNTGCGDSNVLLNTYGEHYWMVDLLLDCSKTDGGWFHVKGYITKESADDRWEGSIFQASECDGSAGGTTLDTRGNQNHVVFCGKINVFKFGEGSCTMDNYPISF